MIYEVWNKHTDEKFEFDNYDDALDKALEVSGVKKIYYVRQWVDEDGVRVEDFGSYSWFILTRGK